MARQERAKEPVVLTEREHRAINLVVSDIRQQEKTGKTPQKFKAKAGNDFNIRKVAQFLHEKSIDISSSYEFSGDSNSHIFQPKPQGEKLASRGRQRGGLGGLNFDPFKDIFGF